MFASLATLARSQLENVSDYRAGERAHSLNFLFVCTLIERKSRKGDRKTNTGLSIYPLLYNSSPPPNTKFYFAQSLLYQHSIYIHTYKLL